MIVDYKVRSYLLPTEREVWLQSGRAERDGYTITKAMLNGLESGELKYIDGQFYRLCRHCMDYLPIEAFYENKRYVLGISYICKTCTATRRRIKAYGVASFITDTGMKEDPHGVMINLNTNTKEIIKRRMNDGFDEKKNHRP